jgi:peptidoglycan/LPS O-acetylase OafA/YrhL
MHLRDRSVHVMRRAILVFAATGLVGCFLPMYYNYEGPEVWSLWQLRHDAPALVYGVIAAYAVATLIGFAGRRITRGLAAIATLAFGVVAYALWPPIPMYVLVGWYLMVLGAYGGCIVSLAATLGRTPEAGEPV